jgi:SNF2 family DNA or RNA helicase
MSSSDGFDDLDVLGMSAEAQRPRKRRRRTSSAVAEDEESFFAGVGLSGGLDDESEDDIFGSGGALGEEDGLGASAENGGVNFDSLQPDSAVSGSGGRALRSGGSSDLVAPLGSGASGSGSSSRKPRKRKPIFSHPPAPKFKVHTQLSDRLKPHQRVGSQFVWSHVAAGNGGRGCILADYMGLGKTLQLVSVITSFMDLRLDKTRSSTPSKDGAGDSGNSESRSQGLSVGSGSGSGEDDDDSDEEDGEGSGSEEEESEEESDDGEVGGYSRRRPNTALVVAPAIVVQNWNREFEKWLSREERKRLIKPKVLDSSNSKTLEERVQRLKKWKEQGGVLLIGYEMFRLLAAKGAFLRCICIRPVVSCLLRSAVPQRSLPPLVVPQRSCSRSFLAVLRRRAPTAIGHAHNCIFFVLFVVVVSLSPLCVSAHARTHTRTLAHPPPHTHTGFERHKAALEAGEGGASAAGSSSASSKGSCGNKIVFRSSAVDHKKRLEDEAFKSLCCPGPDLIILDEGHRLRKDKTRLYQILTSITTRRRVVLTGYPLQNHLREYWCMVDFASPGLIGSKETFKRRFEIPITDGLDKDSTDDEIKTARRRSYVLGKLLETIVIRRDGRFLEKMLPPKHEWVLHCRMSPVQGTLYRAFLKDRRMLKEDGERSGGRDLLASYAISISIVNHPDILLCVAVFCCLCCLSPSFRRSTPRSWAFVLRGAFQRLLAVQLRVRVRSAATGLRLPPSAASLPPLSSRTRRWKMREKQRAEAAEASAAAQRSRGASANRAITVWDDDEDDLSEEYDAGGGAGATHALNWARPTFEDNYQEGDSKNSGKMRVLLRCVVHFFCLIYSFVACSQQHKTIESKQKIHSCCSSILLFVLLSILRYSCLRKDSVVVFSQSLQTLNIIQRELRRENKRRGSDVVYNHLRIDGSTSMPDRTDRILKFNSPKHASNVMLISTKAGGEGVNLVRRARGVASVMVPPARALVSARSTS